MAFESRENSGILFRNERKNKPNQPDYTGNANVGGLDVKISGWIKEGKNGKFLSLAFQDKNRSRPLPAGQDNDDTDIPF